MQKTPALFKKLFTRKLIIRFGIGFVIFLTVLYFSSSAIANYLINKKIEKFEAERHVRISIRNLTVVGLSGINVESIAIVPYANDTLFAAEGLEAHVSFWQLLLLRADIQSVKVRSIACRFVKRGDYCNYRFLFQSHPKENQVTDSKSDYSQQVSTIFNTIFRLLPDNLELHKFLISSENKGNLTKLSSQNIRVANHQFATLLQVEDSLVHQTWKIEGLIDKDNRKFYGKISTQNGEKATFPYINQIYQARVSFDAVSFDVKMTKENAHLTSLTGRTSFKGLEINHYRLSSEDIRLGDGALDYKLNVGVDFAELDSISEIVFNRLSFHPYVFVQKNDSWRIKVSVDKPSFLAADLFASLPKGLFLTLADVKVCGALNYHFLLDVDLNHPNNLKLESSLLKSHFSILNYGELTKMNAPFLYTAYEKDRPVRTFEVGTGNSSFRSLELISPLLRAAVLQSEDGQFFFHKGFRLDAMREALIHDIKVKRFARGGSTISMQLVKNVFLNRHKNIARKLEEALLVWLIEENRITTKDRMFEVYLNVAEWGPMIYGIGEASRFYFDKEPAELTLNEAIFLASIIPSPKRFANSFDRTGQLKEREFWYFNRIAERLCKKGYVTEQQKAEFLPSVRLTGVAGTKLTIEKDSVEIALPVIGL